MKGIIILNEYTRMVDAPFQISAVPEFVWYIAAIMTIIGIVCMLFIKDTNKSAGATTICLVLIIVSVVAGFIIAYNRCRHEQTFQEIYMPGLVDMKEFNETYDIVGREGDIYTVTFRNVNTVEEQ